MKKPGEGVCLERVDQRSCELSRCNGEILTKNRAFVDNDYRIIWSPHDGETLLYQRKFGTIWTYIYAVYIVTGEELVVGNDIHIVEGQAP